MKKFNINEYVFIKLTEKGAQVLANDHNKWVGKMLGNRNMDYYLSNRDENGFYKMQFWCFINNFGELMQAGAGGYFEDNNIYFKEADLKTTVQVSVASKVQ